jgi:hypothetical protein
MKSVWTRRKRERRRRAAIYDGLILRAAFVFVPYTITQFRTESVEADLVTVVDFETKLHVFVL